jgi:ubiquinone biosynthesis protein
VFKLLKPGIEQRLEEDLEILGQLGDFLDEDCAKYHLPNLDYRETFETIRELLLHEVRLDEEQRHLKEAALLYGDTPSVVIPQLLPLCTRRLTAMQRLEGSKIGEQPAPAVRARGGLARTVAEALIAGPIFSCREAALFHADPHAGNLLLTTDGRLGILDWSLIGRLAKEHRIRMVQILLGALALNAQQIATAVEGLSLQAARPRPVMDAIQTSLAKLHRGSMPGVAWLTELLDRLALQAGVRFDADLLLFRKSLLTLEGVLADLAPAGTHSTALDEAVLGVFLRQWTAEWPQRWVAPLASRAFATHLSTADLWAALWSSPAAALRWWTVTLDELSRGFQGKRHTLG